MTDKEALLAHIHRAFDDNRYPGDAYLQGSFEGCEPFEEIAPFKGREDWTGLDSTMLDAHYSALSFFSEAGFRFFLPAYLAADVRGELQTADPLFHLTHGFFVSSAAVAEQSFVRKSGGSRLLNPRRYGAMTYFDHARWRLSVFTREEAEAIVAYLNYRRDMDVHEPDRAPIEAALKSFWLDRAENAPSRERLEKRLQEEEQYFSSASASNES